MKKRSTVAVIIVILSLLIGCLSFVQHRLKGKEHERREHERREHERRERSYEAALTAYTSVLKPGMTREAVHKYLQDHAIAYSTRGIEVDSDDLIRLARERSEQWYCSWLDVSVRVSYAPVSSFEQQSDDQIRIKELSLDRWLRDCL